jgi:hypothetical protein
MLNPYFLNRRCFFVAFLALACTTLSAQQVTGVWKGRIDKKKVEVKIIQNGDSLTGTSYYYESPASYRRYSIRGYFDANDNSVVWWDDRLIEEKGSRLTGIPGKVPLLSVADFNCPGGGEMYLDGRAGPKDKNGDPEGDVSLTKVPETGFHDEWDYVIDHFTTGTNDPDIIDSVSLVAFNPENNPRVEAPPVERPKRPGMVSIPPMRKPEPKAEPFPVPSPPVAARPLTIEEKFTLRKKEFTAEIPLAGDSVELRFYDNAEIDGDSISLFLNDQLLFKHIRLTDRAYTIRLSVSDLKDSNELIMVAENLGSIPPNTSYMVAIVGDKRYEARLASTENSSAMIRLRKAGN